MYLMPRVVWRRGWISQGCNFYRWLWEMMCVTGSNRSYPWKQQILLTAEAFKNLRISNEIPKWGPWKAVSFQLPSHHSFTLVNLYWVNWSVTEKLENTVSLSLASTLTLGVEKLKCHNIKLLKNILKNLIWMSQMCYLTVNISISNSLRIQNISYLLYNTNK